MILTTGFMRIQGEIGILTRSDMDKFGYIFNNFLNLGVSDDQKGDYWPLPLYYIYEYLIIVDKDALKAILAPYRDPHSEGHKRAALWKDKFTIKCVYIVEHTFWVFHRLTSFALFRFIGVWDTVGSLGLPREIDPIREKRRPLFGLPDCLLGEHIEAAYQALAINEMREDFVSSANTREARLYADASTRSAPSSFKQRQGKRKVKF